MKSSLTIFLSFFLLMSSIEPIVAQTENKAAQANEEAASPVFQKGDLMLNAGFSFGLIGYGYGYLGSRSFSIPITANMGYGITDEISIGGYVGYYGASYGPSNSRYRLSNFSFGVQGTFHATPLLNEALDLGIDETKFDYYARLILGYETYSWKYNGTFFSEELRSDNDGRVVFGPVLGVRYLFKPTIGVYIEGGRGAYGWLTMGASFKL